MTTKDDIYNTLIDKLTNRLDAIFEKENIIESKIEENLTMRKIEKAKLSSEIENLKVTLNDLESAGPYKKFKDTLAQIQEVEDSNLKLDAEIVDNDMKLKGMIKEYESRLEEVEKVKSEYDTKIKEKTVQLEETKLKYK
eukprot:CAMPEP_0116943896 /NCGR_PEP_ID=MMETSP0467-20121206/35467_1 /TAXON_ID=283647 /ORGANISM="Mesodinium pulex, Strain SPMC105" /LENGTH=138 /DNA_ID=CAMNT_0004627179 /DNA_START=60 /DNA_END=476 /DNA_ORIENTATION=+